MFEDVPKFFQRQFNGVLDPSVTTMDEVFKRCEEDKVFMRIDKSVNPTKMRAATVSPREMEKISSIKNIIREGRIEKIEKDKIIFKNRAELLTDGDTLHIDCSSNG